MEDATTLMLINLNGGKTPNRWPGINDDNEKFAQRCNTCTGEIFVKLCLLIVYIIGTFEF